MQEPVVQTELFFMILLANLCTVGYTVEWLLGRLSHSDSCLSYYVIKQEILAK